ncbi:MAG: hypothetical protein RDV48_25010 [Candidatus Eremiobacteraeota bacterium]|nr:hypothetical protein [Candidatus Eremiobacteraeota bacterium]
MERERRHLPSGIQRLISEAALDEAFMERFFADRTAGAIECGVKLTPSEEAVLRAVPDSQLSAMITEVRAFSIESFPDGTWQTAEGPSHDEPGFFITGIDAEYPGEDEFERARSFGLTAEVAEFSDPARIPLPGFSDDELKELFKEPSPELQAFFRDLTADSAQKESRSPQDLLSAPDTELRSPFPDEGLS